MADHHATETTRSALFRQVDAIPWNTITAAGQATIHPVCAALPATPGRVSRDSRYPATSRVTGMLSEPG